MFTYPSASTSIIKGNGFYRIKAQPNELGNVAITDIGPGSLIPIDVGFSAIAVGPDSDYEKYTLFYVDPTAPGGVQKIPISKDRPLIGSVASDNAAAYPQSEGEKAKAFIQIADYGSFGSNKARFDAGTLDQKIAECNVDLLIYTGVVPPYLPTKRAPRRYSGSIDLMSAFTLKFPIPGYGRRIMSCKLSRRLSAGTASVELFGYTLSPILEDSKTASKGRVVIDTDSFHIKTLLGSGIFTSGSSERFTHHHNSDKDGYFDFYSAEVVSTVNNGSDSNDGSFYLNLEVRD